jgi:hypothetical protein
MLNKERVVLERIEYTNRARLSTWNLTGLSKRHVFENDPEIIRKFTCFPIEQGIPSTLLTRPGGRRPTTGGVQEG